MYTCMQRVQQAEDTKKPSPRISVSFFCATFRDGELRQLRGFLSDWGVTPPMYRPGQAPADVTPLPHPVSRLGSQILGIHGSTQRPAHLIYQHDSQSFGLGLFVRGFFLKNGPRASKH